MEYRNPQIMGIAVAMIAREFDTSTDVEETETMLHRKFAEMLMNETINKMEYTLLFWYSTGYKDAMKKGEE